MHHNIKLYIELSDEIQQVISENQIDLTTILQNEGIDATTQYEVPAYAGEEGGRSRDLTPFVMLAGSGLLLAAGVAISKILSTLWNKPHLIEYWEEEAWRDADGKILTDKKGKPLVHLVKRYELLEPRKQDSETGLDFKGGNIVIKFTAKEREFDKVKKDGT